ncbi:hypothetical protein Acsp03_54630 [Actinomadura sp. NBRC 104412]|uniref:hypothetical protein n=1 Tax=Actinomadura sp. NBRC 104412 TaxID=3032203 RepID=UPI0024A340B9|nr:hypothetical protein [Actinomadura sp. NBRC 104412]GLZ07997.1 hypothetical protein Acsp03_54630 [Actinomadura sp. NBRC 104412]
MASKPLEQVTLADLVTKDDLKNLVTKDDLQRELGLLRQEIKHELGQEIGSVRQEVDSVRQEVGSVRQEVGSVRQELREEMKSGFNLLLGEIGKIAARQEEQGRILARLVAKSEGVMR